MTIAQHNKSIHQQGSRGLFTLLRDQCQLPFGYLLRLMLHSCNSTGCRKTSHASRDVQVK
jgi:hypothetical protein